MYISLEAEAEEIREKAVNLGWEKAREQFNVLRGGETAKHAIVSVLGNEIRQNETAGVHNPLSVVDVIHGNIKDWDSVVKEYRTHFKRAPDVVVFDSLNIIPDPKTATDILAEILRLTNAGPKVLILIQDSGSTTEGHRVCEYVSDVVLQLDRTYTNQYMPTEPRGRQGPLAGAPLGTAPAQNLSGRPSSPDHLERWSRGTRPERTDRTSQERTYRTSPRPTFPKRRRDLHIPFDSLLPLGLQEGQSQPGAGLRRKRTPSKEWNELLSEGGGEGGLPKGRCTALIGDRGGHKSHLGYDHLLGQVVNGKGNALVISLRDDEGMATLQVRPHRRQRRYPAAERGCRTR